MIVDDSIAGIHAGRNAGCISVAVSKTGNALGLSESDVEKIHPSELHARLLGIEQEFLRAGADLVVESVVELAELFQK